MSLADKFIQVSRFAGSANAVGENMVTIRDGTLIAGKHQQGIIASVDLPMDVQGQVQAQHVYRALSAVRGEGMEFEIKVNAANGSRKMILRNGSRKVAVELHSITFEPSYSVPDDLCWSQVTLLPEVMRRIDWASFKKETDGRPGMEGILINDKYLMSCNGHIGCVSAFSADFGFPPDHQSILIRASAFAGIEGEAEVAFDAARGWFYLRSDGDVRITRALDGAIPEAGLLSVAERAVSSPWHLRFERDDLLEGVQAAKTLCGKESLGIDIRVLEVVEDRAVIELRLASIAGADMGGWDFEHRLAAVIEGGVEHVSPGGFCRISAPYFHQAVSKTLSDDEGAIRMSCEFSKSGGLDPVLLVGESETGTMTSFIAPIRAL